MATRNAQSLQEVKIFAKEDTIWGIPSRLFIGSAVLTVAMITQIPTVFALMLRCDEHDRNVGPTR